MSYMEKILSRADICNIKEFLLYGVEPLSSKNYKADKDIAHRKILDVINENFTEEESENLINMISHYTSLCEEVHFELGLKCGMKLQQSLEQEL